MSHKSENNRETLYDEISIFHGNSSVPKLPEDGTVMVDSKAFYIGKNANWRYSWKTVEDVEFEGRNLTIKCNDKTIECVGNTCEKFHAFREYALKIWGKKQGKKEAKTAIESVPSRGPAKKRRTYGSVRSRANPRVSMVQTTYFSSDDEKEETKPSWKEPEHEEAEQVPSDDEGEEEFNDGESPPGYNDENQSPNVQRKTKKSGKRRLASKILHDADDSDEDMFSDPNVTTPSSKRLVSPANAESDNKVNKAAAGPEPSTKGTQTITNYFSKFTPGNAPSKKNDIIESPAKKMKKSSPFSTSQAPSSPATPLKKDDGWLKTKRTPQRPQRKTPTPSRSRHFPPKLPKEDDSDIESVNSTELPMDLQEAISGHVLRPVTRGKDDIEDSPLSGSRRRTSGVTRGRFGPRPRSLHREDMSPMRPSPKRSMADAVLSPHHSPKRICTLKNNPYANEKISRPIKMTPKVMNPWRGLRNLGNTCYLNSSLQMLFSVPNFVSSLAGKGKDLSKSILSVSTDMKDTSAFRSANPNVVKKAVDAVTDKFEGYEQRDAHEFLSDLVDRVHDELEEERKESGIETTADTPPFPTDEYFRMNVQVCLTCDSCGYAR